MSELRREAKPWTLITTTLLLQVQLLQLLMSLLVLMPGCVAEPAADDYRHCNAIGAAQGGLIRLPRAFGVASG